MKKWIIFSFILIIISSTYAISPFQTIKYEEEFSIMTYNILNFDGGDTGQVTYLKDVLDYTSPDIIVVQEMINQAGVNLFLNGVLNNNYSAAPFVNGYDTDNALFYKHSKVNFNNLEQIGTTLRDISAYNLTIKNNTIIIYSLHLKASTGSTNELKRYNEILQLKNHIDNLPENQHYIIAGDFNIYKASESAYNLLMTLTYDPINRPGNWNNNFAFRDIHTQSTRITNFGGGATGGLDDRFDQILLSDEFNSYPGYKFVDGSYQAFGNDANHFNLAINSGTNLVVPQYLANSLHSASDHLPVIAKFNYIVSNKKSYLKPKDWPIIYF